LRNNEYNVNHNMKKSYLYIAGLAGTVTSFLGYLLARGQNIWFDEAYSIMLAHQSVPRLLELTGVDAHPPLYYLYLKMWAGLFGYSNMALRMSSILLAGLAIFFMIILIKRLFNNKIAVLASSLLILTPLFLRYSYEIRMYVLASIICIIATILLDVALKNKNDKKMWFFYALSVATGMYTLYITVFVWIAHGIFVIFFGDFGSSKNVKVKAKISSGSKFFSKFVPKGFLDMNRYWLVSIIVAIIIYTPWLPSLIDQLRHSALGNVAKAVSPDAVVNITTFMYQYKPSWQLSPLETLLWLGLLVASGWVIVNAWRLSDKKFKRGLLLLTLIVATQFSLIILQSVFSKSILNERYFADISLFFSGLVIVSLATVYYSSDIKSRTVLAGLIILTGSGVGIIDLWTAGNYTFQRSMMPSTNHVVNNVVCGDNTIVLAAHPMLFTELIYYLDNKKCDTRVYNDGYKFGHYGGYAYLENTSKEIFKINDLTAQNIYKVYYVYDEDVPPLDISSRYHLINIKKWDKLSLATYVLSK
jgi:mannosyltransferase